MGTWNEQDHPRKGAGSAGGEGGRFIDKPAAGDDGDLTGLTSAASRMPDAALEAMASTVAAETCGAFGRDGTGVVADLTDGSLVFYDTEGSRACLLRPVVMDGGAWRAEIEDWGEVGPETVAALGRGEHVEPDGGFLSCASVDDGLEFAPTGDERAPYAFKTGYDDPFAWAVNRVANDTDRDDRWHERAMDGFLSDGPNDYWMPYRTADGWRMAEPTAVCALFDEYDDLVEDFDATVRTTMHDLYGTDGEEAYLCAANLHDGLAAVRDAKRGELLAGLDGDGDDVRALAEWASRRDDDALSAKGRRWLAAHAM